MSGEVPSPSQNSETDGSQSVPQPEIEAKLNEQSSVPDESIASGEVDIETHPQSETKPKTEGIQPEADSVAGTAKNPLDNEARLQQLEEEHETLRSQYMRIAADFDNFRKRQTRDNDDLKQQLICNTLTEILPIVDNFERARQQLDPQGEEAQALHRSYQGLYKQLVDVLKLLGVAPMRVVGQTFDPTLHEAVLREPSDEKPEGTVLDEMQRGYHLNGRVLRHALVKVSMGPGSQGESSSQTDQEPEKSSSISDNKNSPNSED